MKRVKILYLMIIALVALMLPEAVFAQNAPANDPGPEWNITIEFRYTKGQEGSLNVPNSIARYGRTYHLISKTDPVLEKKLPATREYTWLIDGTISEAEKSQIEGLENLELTPTSVAIGRVVDKHLTEGGYPTNDVEDIDYTRVIDGVQYNRAAVRFEVEEYDGYDLPLSYEAEIVFRGIEKYMGPGYIVKAVYTTTEDLDDVEQYVVVATYAPDGLAPISGTTDSGSGTTQAQPGVGGEEPAPAAVDEAAASIGDETVPQTAGEGSTAKSINPIAVALIIIAALLGGFIAWMFFTRKRNQAKKRILREEKRRSVLRSQGLVEYDV